MYNCKKCGACRYAEACGTDTSCDCWSLWTGLNPANAMTKTQLVETKTQGIMRLVRSGQLDDEQGRAIASSVITEVLLEIYEAGEMNQR
jgi:hypothetical protein